MPLLNIPDIRQSADHDCADAAIACLLNFWRVSLPQPRISTPTDGADPRHLEAVLRMLQMNVLAGEMRLDDLDYFTRSGRPVVCLMHDSVGHYVIVRGLTVRRVHYHDPAAGLRAVPLGHWCSAWHDRGRMGEAFLRFGIAAWV